MINSWDLICDVNDKLKTQPSSYISGVVEYFTRAGHLSDSQKKELLSYCEGKKVAVKKKAILRRKIIENNS